MPCLVMKGKLVAAALVPKQARPYLIYDQAVQHGNTTSASTSSRLAQPNGTHRFHSQRFLILALERFCWRDLGESIVLLLIPPTGLVELVHHSCPHSPLGRRESSISHEVGQGSGQQTLQAKIRRDDKQLASEHTIAHTQKNQTRHVFSDSNLTNKTKSGIQIHGTAWETILRSGWARVTVRQTPQTIYHVLKQCLVPESAHAG